MDYVLGAIGEEKVAEVKKIKESGGSLEDIEKKVSFDS